MNRGGAREGAGRKTLIEGVERVPLSVRVLPTTRKALEKERDRVNKKGGQTSIGQLIDQAVEGMLDG